MENDMHTPTQKDLNRFWSTVDKSGGRDACWPWIGWKGYGEIYWGGKRRQATQVSWELENGKEFPKGLFALHKCDNPPCVNPNHLFPGNYRENYEDAKKKGRAARGERLPQHKLSDKQIADIRQRYERGGVTQYQLAEMFQVEQGHISSIVNYKKRTNQNDVNKSAGKNHHARKLSDAQVADIRARYSGGTESQSKLAVIFQVCQAAIWKIVHHKIRKP